MKKIKNKIKGFYLGILMGPDFSTIQSQKFTSMGYSAGLLAGYRINKHWAVEAGAIWDRKKYYTDGKYFDKSGANIPPNVMVHYLNGVCEMFEFPVVVRYNINLQKNLLFATAGLTSYIMRKESYRYGAMSNGSYYEGYRSYKRSGNTLFANMHMSAGYDYGLSANWSVRVEPYINLPLKNIGVGKMPISSKGVYIGITRAIK